MGLFGNKKQDESDETVYKVTYQGGLAELPKAKIGEIRLALTSDAFVFRPTAGSQKFWTELSVPYATVKSVDVVGRVVTTFEGLLAGANSAQLSQDNNLNFTYLGADGREVILRVEMLTGFTVMAQAGKCREFMDYLRTAGIQDKFQDPTPSVPAQTSEPSAADQIRQLAELHQQGILSDDEFAAAKAKLLGL